MRDKLNTKQKAFVREYLKDRNATQSAIRAGYSKKTARQIGARLLSNVAIRDLIDGFEQKATDKAILSLVDAKKVLSQIAQSGDQDKDRVSAINSLAKMEGWEQPKKHEVSGGITFVFDTGEDVSDEN